MTVSSIERLRLVYSGLYSMSMVYMYSTALFMKDTLCVKFPEFGNSATDNC